MSGIYQSLTKHWSGKKWHHLSIKCNGHMWCSTSMTHTLAHTRTHCVCMLVIATNSQKTKIKLNRCTTQTFPSWEMKRTFFPTFCQLSFIYSLITCPECFNVGCVLITQSLFTMKFYSWAVIWGPYLSTRCLVRTTELSGKSMQIACRLQTSHVDYIFL